MVLSMRSSLSVRVVNWRTELARSDEAHTWRIEVQSQVLRWVLVTRWWPLLLWSVVWTAAFILTTSSRIVVLEDTRGVVGADARPVWINFEVWTLFVKGALEELLSFLLLILALEVLGLITSRVEAIDVIIPLVEEVYDTWAIVRAWRSVASTSWSCSWHVGLDNLVHVADRKNASLRCGYKFLDVSLLFTPWHVSMSWCLMVTTIVLSQMVLRWDMSLTDTVSTSSSLGTRIIKA